MSISIDLSIVSVLNEMTLYLIGLYTVQNLLIWLLSLERSMKMKVLIISRNVLKLEHCISLDF